METTQRNIQNSTKIGVGKYIRTPKIKEKMSNSHKGKLGFWKNKKRLDMVGDKHVLWKGNKVSYSGLHHWVKRKLGKANKCQNILCEYPRIDANGKILKKPKKFEWANISKKYNRSEKDFISLCVSCHQKWDLHKKEIIYERD